MRIEWDDLKKRESEKFVPVMVRESTKNKIKTYSLKYGIPMATVIQELINRDIRENAHNARSAIPIDCYSDVME